MAGVFDDVGFYDIINNKTFTDALVYGLGSVYWRVKNGKIALEWVFIDELRVDDHDGMKKRPNTIHYSHMVPREELVAEHPDFEDASSMSGPSLPAVAGRKRRTARFLTQ